MLSPKQSLYTTIFTTPGSGYNRRRVDRVLGEWWGCCEILPSTDMMVTVLRNPHQTKPTGTISTPTALIGPSELGGGGGADVMKAGTVGKR